MQKYKKWKQVLSVSTAVCLSIAGAGSLMGCGSTDRGKDKADFRGIQSNGTVSGE